MKKYKLTQKELIKFLIVLVIYLTWMITTFVYSTIKDWQEISPSHFYWTNGIGSLLVLIYSIFYFNPIIPIFSKRVNNRIEEQVVQNRRNYCYKILVSIEVCFFIMAIIILCELNNKDLHPEVYAWGVLELFATITMTLYAVFTISYISKMKSLYYMDKLQHINVEVEQEKMS